MTKRFRVYVNFFKKVLAFLNPFVYNTACRHDIGLSPSGKALDSDSSTSGVRIPQAQLTASRNNAGGFFSQGAGFDLGRPHPHLHEVAPNT